MKNNEDKNLNSNDNLDELMKVASEKVEEDKEIEVSNEENKKSTKKVILFTSGGLLVFAGVILSGALFMNNPQEFVDKTETPGWVEGGNADENSNDNYNPWDFEKPVELSDWANAPYDKESFWQQDDIENKILEASKEYQGFYFSVASTNSGIPHGYDDEQLVGPYTNDIEKRYLEDGSVNGDFSYALTEDYEKAYVTYTERLINPVFGDWSKMQSSDDLEIKSNMQFNALKDMFTVDWWNENIKESEDYSSLPIFAEWTQNDWDKFNIDESNVDMYGTFYGKITETDENIIQSEQIGVDQEGQAIMKVSSPVTYSAFGEDGDNVEIHGELELTLKSNSDSTDVANRVVISDAELKFKQ